jgi:hypothetical protein
MIQSLKQGAKVVKENQIQKIRPTQNVNLLINKSGIVPYLIT